VLYPCSYLMKLVWKSCVIFGNRQIFSADMALFLLSSHSSHPGHLSAGNRRSNMSGSEVWRELGFRIMCPVSSAIVCRRQRPSSSRRLSLDQKSSGLQLLCHRRFRIWECPFESSLVCNISCFRTFLNASKGNTE
jgi:hypothetical protein